MGRTRPTVADIRALEGARQLSMLRVMTLDEAEAAEQAGIDMISVPPELISDRQFRDAAPNCCAIPGLEYGDYIASDDYLRGAFAMIKASADAVYCAVGMETVRRLRSFGADPEPATWTGGFKAMETARLVALKAA